MLGSRIADMNGLYQLFYTIRASAKVNKGRDEVVRGILEISHLHNKANGLTGALLLCDGWFLQVLEGRRIDVDVVYGRIEVDSRHHSLRKVHGGPLIERRFAAWSMCGRALSPKDWAVVEVLETSGKFKPEKFTAEKCLGLLTAVSRIQAASA
jgi:hypothetical protein